jgi:hypothetical protein
VVQGLEPLSKCFDQRPGRYIEVIETLKTAQLLHPKEPSTEVPAEATIPAVLPVLSSCDEEGSDKGSDGGSDKDNGLLG